MRLILLACLLLQGCVTMIAGNMGAGATVVAAAETVDQAKTAADVVAYGTTGKTLTDHALDAVTGRDCNLIVSSIVCSYSWRIFLASVLLSSPSR